jgi:non-heme chloroperoxidase
LRGNRGGDPLPGNLRPSASACRRVAGTGAALPATCRGQPSEVDRSAVSEFIGQIGADRPAATKAFLDRSYNIDLLGGIRVSDQAWQNSFHVAIGASAAAVSGCAAAWLEDFRGDLARIIVPVLVVQGGLDRITPPEVTGNRLPGLLRGARHVVIPDGPHAIIWTHANEVNQALLGFIGAL